MRKPAIILFLGLFVSCMAYSNISITPSTDISTIDAPGNNEEVVFNDSGSFAGDSGLTWDNVTKRLKVGTVAEASQADLHILSSGSSALFRISSAGTGNTGGFDLALGTTIDLKGLGSNDMTFFTNNVEKMRITTGGNIGIGATNPLTTLQIKANTPGTIGSAAAGQIIIQGLGTSINTNAVLTGYNSDGVGDPNEQLWYLGSSSSSNSDITFLNRISAKLTLGTNGASRLTIDSDGDVGIGTAFPVSLLHISENSTVAGSTLSLERVDAIVTDGNPVGIVSFLGGEDGTEEQVASITAAADEAWGATTSGSRLVFGTTPSGATNDTERMRIDSLGDVTHTNFTKLGSDAPLIKYKKFTGTGGTVEGWSTDVAHGLGDTSKIVSAKVLLTAPNGNIIPPGFTTVSEFQYDFFIDPTNVKVRATATNSGSILVSSPFVVLLALEK